MTMGNAARAAALAGGALLVSACTAELLSSGAGEPRPVTLSHRPAPAASVPFEGARETAAAVSGSYVRVLIVDPREAKRAGRAAPSGTDVVTGASGAIVDARGWIVTAAHIAMHPRLEARITTTDGRVHEAAVVAVAPGRELALLKMRPYPGMRAARLGDSGQLSAGDPVLSIGTPGEESGVVLLGQVLNPRRAQRIQYGAYGYDDAIELVLDAEPGSSGGPLFNRAGELVGIVASFSLGNTNPGEYAPTQLAWAVPSNAIARYLREVAGP